MPVQHGHEHGVDDPERDDDEEHPENQVVAEIIDRDGCRKRGIRLAPSHHPRLSSGHGPGQRRLQPCGDVPDLAAVGQHEAYIRDVVSGTEPLARRSNRHVDEHLIHLRHAAAKDTDDAQQLRRDLVVRILRLHDHARTELQLQTVRETDPDVRGEAIIRLQVAAFGHLIVDHSECRLRRWIDREDLRGTGPGRGAGKTPDGELGGTRRNERGDLGCGERRLGHLLNAAGQAVLDPAGDTELRPLHRHMPRAHPDAGVDPRFVGAITERERKTQQPAAHHHRQHRQQRPPYLPAQVAQREPDQHSQMHRRQSPESVSAGGVRAARIAG